MLLDGRASPFRTPRLARAFRAVRDAGLPRGSGFPGAPLLVRIASGVLLLATLIPPPAEAQQGGGGAVLDAVEAAMDEGRFEAARAGVERWWEGGEAGRDRREFQRALWLRARLTVEPEGAELLYRRLVVEFPGGIHSDEALLRLAQGAQARGDGEAATRYLEILVRDYPSSPHRVTARAELTRAETGAAAAVGRDAPAPTAQRAPDPRSAAEPAQQAAAPPVADPPPAAAPPTTAPVDPAPPSAGAPAPGEPASLSGTHTLQFGAFGGVERARAVAAELRTAGLEVRVVQVEGSPLFRVRGEAFPDRGAADARARELRERGFELLVSADRDRETRVDG